LRRRAGSYLAASHEALEYNPEGTAAWTRTYQQSGVPFQLRTAHEFADLAFRDLEIAEPGLVMVSEWRPDNNAPRPLLSEVGINGQSRESRNSQRLANGRGNAHGRTQGKHGQSAAMRRLPHSNHVTVSVTVRITK
jgi:hypothetical protein